MVSHRIESFIQSQWFCVGGRIKLLGSVAGIISYIGPVGPHWHRVPLAPLALQSAFGLRGLFGTLALFVGLRPPGPFGPVGPVERLRLPFPPCISGIRRLKPPQTPPYLLYLPFTRPVIDTWEG